MGEKWLKWPDTLKLDPGAKKALEAVPEKHPLLAKWPEGEKFLVSDQAKAIGDILIPEFHKHLVNAKVAYLFKQHVGGRGVTLFGKAALSSAKLKFLSQVDFVLEINHTIWADASLQMRAAMIDHELSHCGVDDNGAFCFLQHDIEEFFGVVQRWGQWHGAVTTMRQVLTSQLELVPA